MSRKVARNAAMQMIYEHLQGGEGGEETLLMVYDQLRNEGTAHLDQEDPDVSDRAFIQNVFQGVMDHLDELDAEIEKFSTWPLDRLSLVDLTIMRMAVWEILFENDPDVPGSVAISEAVELTKTYSDPEDGRFVNGILGSVLRAKEGKA